MSAQKDVWIECDGLSMFGCGEVLHERTATKSRKLGASRGWQVNAPGGKDYCPEYRKTKAKAATS
jgi:hypothetical protein